MTFYQAPSDDDRERHIGRSSRTFHNLDFDKTLLLEMLRHCVVVVFVAGFAMALVNAFDGWLPWPAPGILLALGIIGIAVMAKVAGNERGDTLREMLRHCVVMVFVAGFAMALGNALNGGEGWPWPAAGILLALGIIGIAVMAKIPGEKREERHMARREKSGGMRLPETFGWYRHVIMDSHKQIAVLEVTPAVVEFKECSRLAGKFGADVVYDKLGIGRRGRSDSLYDNGACGVLLLDRSYGFVKRVLKADYDASVLNWKLQALPFLIPISCRDTAVEIAESIANSLAEAVELGIQSASEFEYSFEFEYDDGSKDEIVFSPTYLEQCLAQLEFTLSDGTSVPELQIGAVPGYVAKRSAVIGRLGDYR